MQFNINQLGKRWFVVRSKIDSDIMVEASFQGNQDSKRWNNDIANKGVFWTLTGKGSKKYRKEIIDEISKILVIECRYCDTNGLYRSWNNRNANPVKCKKCDGLHKLSLFNYMNLNIFNN